MLQPGVCAGAAAAVCDNVYLWVAVTLIDCRVGAQEVKVALAISVPDKGTLSFLQHYRYGGVVVGTILLLAVNQLQLNVTPLFSTGRIRAAWTKSLVSFYRNAPSAVLLKGPDQGDRHAIHKTASIACC